MTFYRERNPDGRRPLLCRRRFVDCREAAWIVRIADPVLNKRQQRAVLLFEQFGQVAQALMAPPDRGPVRQKVGAEGDRLFRCPSRQEQAAKLKRRLVGGNGRHVAGGSGVRSEEIARGFELEPVGHRCYFFLTEHSSLRRGAGQVSVRCSG